MVVFVQYISDAARHSCGKIVAGSAKDNDSTAGHIFTAMLTDTFDNSHCAGIADTEAFSGDAVDKGSSAGGAVQSYIADDDVFFRLEACAFGRINNQFAA